MEKNSKIFVAGGCGMVGGAIVRCLKKKGYQHISAGYHQRKPKDNDKVVEWRHIDLTIQRDVQLYFQKEKPDYVILAAAKVGGIHANNTYPAEFIGVNLGIQQNVITAVHENKVKRLLFLGSSCIYPQLAPQPMREEDLLTGKPEPTNEPYAIAKIAGIKMCEAYNRQYGVQFIAVMPTNLYGPEDNFDLETSHVLPALIRKIHEAKAAGGEQVEIWGTGKPRREFLHVDDMADACVFVLNMDDKTLASAFLAYPEPCFVNVGAGRDITIMELAELIKRIVGFSGKLVFDTGKPDGAPRKLLDVSRLSRLGWKHKIPLEEGVRSTYEWFKSKFCMGSPQRR